MNKVLKRNAEYGDNFVQKIDESAPVDSWIKPYVERKEIRSIVDLGCGDGGLLIPIAKNFKDKSLVGIDISPRRISGLKKSLPEHLFICGDVCNSPLKSASFDLVTCTQVIEHVENDAKLVEEFFRILKPRRYLYVGTVMKKPWAVYKYRNKGRFVLDPTHEKEYRSKEDFLRMFEGKFKVIQFEVRQVKRKRIFEIPIPGFYILTGIFQKI